MEYFRSLHPPSVLILLPLLAKYVLNFKAPLMTKNQWQGVINWKKISLGLGRNESIFKLLLHIFEILSVWIENGEFK